eukprot:6197812-Pleurochrysis_carterae.AAC.2
MSSFHKLYAERRLGSEGVRPLRVGAAFDRPGPVCSGLSLVGQHGGRLLPRAGRARARSQGVPMAVQRLRTVPSARAASGR